MSSAPVISPIPPTDTVGALAQRVKDRINEPIGAGKMQGIYDDIGDAIESIWESAMLATLSKFIKGPVNQLVTSRTTNIVSVPDPTTAPTTGLPTPGGALPIRTYYVSYCLVTDSGSTTRVSPLATYPINANLLGSVAPPLNPSTQDVPEGVVGWYVFVGYNPDGSDQGQQSLVPMPFNQVWFESPAGITQAPNAPSAPSANTTGDNIFSINRIDVQNVDMTWTQWLQTNIGSTAWTQMQHRIATQTTWQNFAYDLIDNRQLEVRPDPQGYPLNANYFYVYKPRRPRFPQSRLPFTSFACQEFLFNRALSRYLWGIYEFEAGDRWNKASEEERQRIMLQIGA